MGIPVSEEAPGHFTYPTAKTQEARALIAFSRALGLLQQLNRSMTAEQAQVFLMVTLDEGKPHSGYSAMSGLKQATISRIFSDLSHYRRTRLGAEEGSYLRAEGFGLLEQRTNPLEMRQKPDSQGAPGGGRGRDLTGVAQMLRDYSPA